MRCSYYIKFAVLSLATASTVSPALAAPIRYRMDSGPVVDIVRRAEVPHGSSGSGSSTDTSVPSTDSSRAGPTIWGYPTGTFRSYPGSESGAPSSHRTFRDTGEPPGPPSVFTSSIPSHNSNQQPPSISSHNSNQQPPSIPSRNPNQQLPSNPSHIPNQQTQYPPGRQSTPEPHTIGPCRRWCTIIRSRQDSRDHNNPSSKRTFEAFEERANSELVERARGDHDIDKRLRLSTLGKFVRRALGTSVTSAGVSRDVPHSQEMIAAMRALDERDVA